MRRSFCMRDSQLTAADAAGTAFDRLIDLVPDDDGALLLPLPPDARAALTYRGLRAFSSALNEHPALASLGPTARIAAALPSRPELAAGLLSLTASGRALAPINPELGEAEMAFEVEDIPADLLVVPRGRHGVPHAVAAALGVPLVELAPSSAVCGCFDLGEAACNLEAISTMDEAAAADAAARAGTAAAAGAREAACLVMHTSGTTRRPKVAPPSHFQLGMASYCRTTDGLPIDY